MSKDNYFSVHRYYDIPQEGGRCISVPVYIGADSLIEELEICLRMVSSGDAISYRETPVAELMLYMILEKLQILYQLEPDEAQTAARRMIQILEESNTDDDFFPHSQIQAIRSIAQIA